MNTFLKILGIILLAFIALKLAPLILGLIGIMMGLVMGAGVLVTGVLALIAFVAISALVGLAPIWIPVALIGGAMILICRLMRGPAAV